MNPFREVYLKELSDKQKKIDKNHNGKLDGQDFAILRGKKKNVKEESEQINELSTDTLNSYKDKVYKDYRDMKPGNSSANRVAGVRRANKRLLAKEEAEKSDKPVGKGGKVETKKYSWGTMKTVHHGSDFSIPLHPEHHQAIAKLKDQQEHKFKDETGRHWTAKKSGEHVHFQGANNGGSTHVPAHTMHEEYINELSNDTLQRYKDKAKKSAADLSARGEYKKSNDRLLNHMKASGKQIEKTTSDIKKAVRGEEVELQEANHREFASQGKMHPDMAKHMKTGEHMDYYEHGTGDKVHGKVIHKSDTEVHMKQTHDSYDPKKKGTVHKFKISDKLDEACSCETVKPRHVSTEPDMANQASSLTRAKMATNKLAKKTVRTEEVEQIDELSKTTLGSYAKKASHDATIRHSIAKDFENMADRARKRSSKSASTELASKYKSKSWKRKAGVGKAIDRLTKEEVEQIDEEGYTLHSKHQNADGTTTIVLKSPSGKMVKHTGKNVHSYVKGKYGVQSEAKTNDIVCANCGGPVHKGTCDDKQKWDKKMNKEQKEIGHDDEKIVKAHLDKIQSPLQKSILKKIQDMQKKHLEIVDGMPTAGGHSAEVKFGEETELNIDESSTIEESMEFTEEQLQLIEQFIEIAEKLNMSKASMGTVIKDFKASTAPQFAGKSPEKRRQMAIAAKMKSESDESLSFKSFLTQLDEIKMSDLPARKVSGSYGTEYYKGEKEKDKKGYDADDETKEPTTVKRGRGRPAGSSSGARQKGSTPKKKGSGVEYTGFKLHLPNK